MNYSRCAAFSLVGRNWKWSIMHPLNRPTLTGRGGVWRGELRGAMLGRMSYCILHGIYWQLVAD